MDERGEFAYPLEISNGGNALRTLEATAISCLDVDGTLCRGIHMAEPKTDRGAIYEVLRRELIHVLRERHSRGHFAWVTEGTNYARGRFFAELTHSIADILVIAYPKKVARVYAAALADAETIVGSVLDHDFSRAAQCPPAHRPSRL
jgi:hypothetical protein